MKPSRFFFRKFELCTETVLETVHQWKCVTGKISFPVIGIRSYLVNYV